MSKSLVIVESPAKAKTIKKYLGDDFTIKASVGHVRDLPKKNLSVDIENSFTPEYEVLPDKKKVIADIKAAAKPVDTVYLAPDPDREGEAIAFHIVEACGGFKGKEVKRVLFNEITKKGITEAMKSPIEIDTSRVDAQQARRILDRLVGYKISPLLWKHVKRGSSAGRVQSVALRLIIEREAEIKAFNQEEYWSILADLKGKKPPKFEAKLGKIDGKKVTVKNEEQAQNIQNDLAGKDFIIDDIKKKKRKRSAFPPFITSTLQQEAARRYRFNAKKTMMIAQQLYEGIKIGSEGEVGLITYMRTDSFRVSDDAIEFGRKYIEEKFGKDYLPDTPNSYKSKKSAQEGHEAIRPTELRPPEGIDSYLNSDQKKIYGIIFQRFIASQMNQAEIDGTSFSIKAVGKKEYLFSATGNVVAFPGFLKIYDDTVEKATDDDAEEESQTDVLPQLDKGDKLNVNKIFGKQHFTQPPPRYTEASLIKVLEEKGIGRPSTYATIMSVIRAREYVVADKSRRFTPTSLGTMISTMLTATFNDLLNSEFTAGLEDKLDNVETGKLSWIKLLKDFYKPFEIDLKNAGAKMDLLKKEMEKTDEVCDKCGQPMAKKVGKFGEFLACTGYPDCKNTKELESSQDNNIEEEPLDLECEKCGKPMVRKKGRFGDFLACTDYPECKTTKKITAAGEVVSNEPRYVEGEKCPQCESQLQYRQGRFGEFISCSNYPKCKYIKKEIIRTETKCPEEGCNGFLVEKKSRFGKMFYSCENYPKCKFAVWNKPVNKECPACKFPFLTEKVTKRKGTFYACHDKACGYESDPIA
ncbi:MAG: type I DNA topoisomerase [Nitrospinae bacterium]|nr:type I DNA topoisomerase [Nitrospinota bacterium]